MLLEGLADVGCRLVVIEVILFLSHREATLIHVQDVLRSVLLVGTKTAEEELLLTVGSLLELDIQQLLVGLRSLQTLDERHQRRHTLLITAHGIHRQFIKVAQLLLQRTLGVGVALQFCQNAVDAFVVVFL